MRKIVLIIIAFFYTCIYNAQNYPWNDIILNNSALASVSRSEMIVENEKIYFIGSDFKVHNYWRDASGKWNENVLLSTMQSAIANSGLVKDQQGNIYYVGNDGFIYKCEYNSGWIVSKITPTGNWLAAKNDSRLAISFPGNQTQIYYVATDSKIHYILNNGSSWSSDIRVSGSAAVRVNSPLLSEGTDKVYYIGSDSQIKNQFLSGSNWYDAPLNTSAQTVRANSDLGIDEVGKIYYIGQDNKIHRFSWTGSWTELPLNSSAPTVANFCNFTYNNGQVFYKATDGYIKVIYSNGSLFANATSNTTTHQNLSVWKTHFQSGTYGASFYFDVNGKLHRLTANIQITSKFPTTGSPKKYERFEIGVDIPSSLENDINNFCNNAHTNPPYPAGNKNPYNPEQIMVKTTFQNGNNSYIRYGFFYRDVTRQNYKTYIIAKPLDNHPFRVRIAPEHTGSWVSTTELYVNGVLAYSGNYNFTTDPSNRRGPLSFPGGNKNKYLVDANGDVFFISGLNADVDCYWPTSTQPDNPDWPRYQSPSSTGIQYDQQRSTIIDLANKGGNFVRLRMLPHAYELEGAYSHLINSADWPNRTLEKNLNNYDVRQNKAWELDNTIKTLEDNNVYSMFNLFYDPAFIHYDDFCSSPVRYDQDNWSFNPYSTIPFPNPVTNSSYPLVQTSYGDSRTAVSYMASNPSYSNSVYAFFADLNPNSFRYKCVQNKLFYIMARWGYSHNIAMWQIMNETDNTGNTGKSALSGTTCVEISAMKNENSLYNSDYTPPNSTVGFTTTMINWQNNINSYLKTFYPNNKLSINGFGNGYNYNTSILGQNPNLDIYSANLYSDNIDYNKGRFEAQSPYKVNSKAFLSSEQGSIPKVDWCTDVEAHNTVWSGVFTGQLGTPLYFWNQHDENGTLNKLKYGKILDFINSTNSIGSNYMNSVNWTSSVSIISSGPSSNPIKKLENFYMVSDNKRTVIGWIHNYSYNWYGSRFNNLYGPGWPVVYPSCSQSVWHTDNISNFDMTPHTKYPTYTSSETGLYPINAATVFDGSSSEPFVELDGLYSNSVYLIEFYDPYLGGYITSMNKTILSDANGKIKFGIFLNNYMNTMAQQYPDYAFRATLQTQHNKLATTINEERNSEASQFAIYPNPNKGKFVIENYFKGKVNYSILDLHGRVIREFVVDDEKIEIDLSNYDKGIYFIKCNINGTTEVKKVIVQ